MPKTVQHQVTRRGCSRRRFQIALLAVRYQGAVSLSKLSVPRAALSPVDLALGWVHFHGDILKQINFSQGETFFTGGRRNSCSAQCIESPMPTCPVVGRDIARRPIDLVRETRTIRLPGGIHG